MARRHACFIPPGRRRGKCVCPEPECGGECCAEEQICGVVVDPDRGPPASQSEGCCLPPGAVLADGCSGETVFQCCDLEPEDPNTTHLCCETDDTTGVATCCAATVAAASASSNRVTIVRRAP